MSRIREIASTITVLGAAGAVVWGVFAALGPTAAAAVSGALVAIAGTVFGRVAICELRRMRVATEATEYHLRPNGHDDDLPPDERSDDPRGTPLRELVIRSRVDLRRVHERLERGDEWMQRLERQADRVEGADRDERERVREREDRMDERSA